MGNTFGAKPKWYIQTVHLLKPIPLVSPEVKVIPGMMVGEYQALSKSIICLLLLILWLVVLGAQRLRHGKMGSIFGLVITYTDSTSTTTSPICSTGSTGETGIGVKSVAEQYYLSTSYSTPTGGSWQTSVPAWQDGKYIWTRVVITYTNNTYTETDPVCVTGGKGPSGNDGVGISAVDVLFYLSTSSSSLEGGAWSTTSPAWVEGKYLWTKTKVTYTNGSTWESDPACITGSQGKTGLPGAMLRPRGVWKANTSITAMRPS